ncbi:hypothetical protein E3N88_08580 [Mikania micrantha]|uniref:Uncharacterized protein n=1 Tax=Mikania micrantha TaxID=192012 RepID=A0A5N6PGP3_9ASTR|nr:hypothetical protein E3N88_08580 [Mikania micrantha]
MKPVMINGRLDWDDGGGYGDDLLESGEVFESFFRQDYSPPPPPPPPPHPPSASCEDDLGGVGSLDTTCKVVSSLNLTRNIYVSGKGNFYILPNVTVNCSFVPGCEIGINVAGNFSLGENARILVGSFDLIATNAGFGTGSLVNTTGLAGDPPEHTSGTPQGVDGGGGGHGGRGAACLVDDKQLQEDIWGGDAYAWSSLAMPMNYGSKGGTTSNEVDYGGGGGGKIAVMVDGTVEMNGLLLAEGGDGSLRGGWWFWNGNGKISACGGSGFGGGGGGRIATDVFSRHGDPKIFVHGGYSLGCPSNAGAAGTLYDAVPRSLVVDNLNMTTGTDTLLMEFPHQRLLTSIFIRNFAKAAVPLLWGHVQVQGQISLLDGAILSFGLAHYASSEFEVLAEELLLINSVIIFLQVYGTLRMSVKRFLMWNSQLIVDSEGERTMGTSIIVASNLIVLKESSRIQSNANLEIGSGSALCGPLENATTYAVTPKLKGCMGSVIRGQINRIGDTSCYGGTCGYGWYNDTCIDGGLPYDDAVSTASDGVLVMEIRLPAIRVACEVASRGLYRNSISILLVDRGKVCLYLLRDSTLSGISTGTLVIVVDYFAGLLTIANRKRMLSVESKDLEKMTIDELQSTLLMGSNGNHRR